MPAQSIVKKVLGHELIFMTIEKRRFSRLVKAWSFWGFSSRVISNSVELDRLSSRRIHRKARFSNCFILMFRPWPLLI